jgi:UDP-N-acetylmuramoylalanine--D-glutamate ligase
VAGARVVGLAVGDVLARRGARVTVVDASDDDAVRERAAVLEILGATVRLGDADTLPAGVDLVVVSPGFPPHHPLVRAAADAGVPVWGDVELAWRLRPAGGAPWLCLTGTNGKTTAVRMLAAMLEAGGRRAVAAGNVGLPLLDAVLADPAYDVLAVELSSFQLHYTSSMRPYAAAVLNVAPDHLDWHGGLDAYARDKGRIYAGTEIACVYNVADARTEQLVRDADVAEGCRAIGFTTGVPDVGMLGVVDDVLVDRAYVAERATSAAELATLADVRPAAPHNVENALAAAALARAFGVPPGAVRAGLRAFRPEPHRITLVATIGGVDYVDDSKATNPHAAAASLRAYESVVWVAGGLAKGASFDELVSSARGRLRAAVLLGRDRAAVADALARHAPEVPVVDLDVTDTGTVMDTVVARAAEVARPGDTVLLAPACASMDLFASYVARGEAFAAAVTRLAAGRGDGSAG